MLVDKIRFAAISALTISLVFSEPTPQNGNFNIYEVNSLNGIVNVLSGHDQIPNNHNHYHYNQYQQAPFLTQQTGTRNSEPVYQSSDACENYWSIQNDFNEVKGIITIPQPHYTKGFLHISLSVAARLPTVSFYFMQDINPEKN